MRIILTLHPKAKLVLPVHYNHILQGMIYRHLDEALAEWYHDTGYTFEKRNFKMFTFSRLFGRNRTYNPRRKSLCFKGPVILRLGSVHHDFLHSLVTHFMRNKGITLRNQFCHIHSIAVEKPIEPTLPATIRCLSPITVYSTFTQDDGRKYTQYYTPDDPEFAHLLADNLRRKALALYGEDIELPPIPDDFIRPLKVNPRDQVITQFKGIWIKGWMGTYQINLPQPYFDLAYQAGLGGKNAQGFGMIEYVTPK